MNGLTLLTLSDVAAAIGGGLRSSGRYFLGLTAVRLLVVCAWAGRHHRGQDTVRDRRSQPLHQRTSTDQAGRNTTGTEHVGAQDPQPDAHVSQGTLTLTHSLVFRRDAAGAGR